MEQDDALLIELRSTYRDRDWFYDVGYDQYGRPVVYVKYECHETNWDLPDRISGKQLLVHFAGSLKSNKEDYFVKDSNSLSSHPLTQSLPSLFTITFIEAAKEAQIKGIDVGVGQCVKLVDGELIDKEELERERELELSVRTLTDELDRLEKLCGSNILGEIFFEENDGKNAVTNLSAKYPEVRKRIHRLYELYGFDVIYEELEL